MEVATTGGAGSAGATTTAAPQTAVASPNPQTPSAGVVLTSMPTGMDWANGFKNEEVKSYIAQKGFKSPESLAESYKNLESKMGAPADRMLVLPEKMEGDAVKSIFERLGMPKEAKGYDFVGKDVKDAKPEMVEKIQNIFHSATLTTSQAQAVAKGYDDMVQAQAQVQAEATKNAIIQADASLQKQWGAEYERNVEIAKQGVKILGLDAKTLDMMEALQGREQLYKTLQKIGVSVGESSFVDGAAQNAQALTPDQAQEEIKSLMKDQKFYKKLEKGDKEANERWSKLNQIAFPGEKQIG